MKFIDTHSVHSSNERNENKEEIKSKIRISVENTEIEILEKERKALFQPFKQVQRSAGGIGGKVFVYA